MAYKVLDLVQGTRAWLDARYDFVTASDVATILNVNPYETPLDLFERKSARVEKQVGERTLKLFDHGHAFEKEMKLHLEKIHPITLSNPVITNESWPHLMASLDGIHNETIYEFKYSEKSVSEIPKYHMPQVQTQLLLSESALAVYIRGRSKDDYQTFVVEPDLEMQALIIDKTTHFFDNLQSGTPPDPCERDYFNCDDLLFVDLRAQKKILDDAQAQYDLIKNQLAEKYKEQRRIKGHGVLLMRSLRRGSIPYSKCPEVQALDLEKYRGKSSEVVTVKVTK